MKRVNKIINLVLIITMLFVFMPQVKAAGSATFAFSGPSSTTVGSTIEVSLNVSNIQNVPLGINAIGAKIIFDTNYLELTKTTSLSAMPTSFGKTSKKIAFLSSSEDFNISANSGIMKFTFTVLKTGTTVVKTEDLEVSDGKGSLVTVSDASLSINITEPVPKSTNANLSSLSVNGYNLSPTFAKDTLNYNVTVPHNVGSVVINATPEDRNARVANTGSKTLQAAGTQSKFTIVVTAEDGVTKKSYVVNIDREAAPAVASNDNTLKNLSVDGYTMSPAFNKNTLTYSVSVPNSATEVMINALANNAKAKVEVTGNTNLKVGENTVSVKVTAEDGSVKTYTVKVTREKEDEPVVTLDGDATLKSLSISGYTLSPTFNKNTNVYSINVGENITGLDVDAIPSSNKAKVEVIGNKNWKYGVNNVSIVVTAENGNKNTYIVNVNRKSPEDKAEEPKSQNNYLRSLSVDGGTIKPGFNKDTSNYTITVPYDVSRLNVRAVALDSKAHVEILGNTSLLVGQVTTVQVKVTAEDGSIRIYTVNATRSSKSSNTYLKSLTVKDGSLSPNFDKKTLNYSVEVKGNVKSLDLSAIAENSKAKVEILGNENLKDGKNTILIKVTDENGFNRVYQIDVLKTGKTIFGIPLADFFMWFFIVLGLISLGLLLFLLLKRRKKEEPPVAPTPVIHQTVNPSPVNPAPVNPTPVIEFKPEFNFGSKNGTDDDVVYQGTLNQGNILPKKEEKKLLGEAYYEEADYEEKDDAGFDLFDETITKEELIHAIKEGMETKNVNKLKMLLKQDELNQLKKQVKEQESRKTRSDRYDDDEF